MMWDSFPLFRNDTSVQQESCECSAGCMEEAVLAIAQNGSLPSCAEGVQVCSEKYFYRVFRLIGGVFSSRNVSKLIFY